jgi:hypothetical protein
MEAQRGGAAAAEGDGKRHHHDRRGRHCTEHRRVKGKPAPPPGSEERANLPVQ